jgi:hypothetical protein
MLAVFSPDRADPGSQLIPENDTTMTAACIDLSNVFDGDASDGTTRTIGGEMQRLRRVLRNIPVVSVELVALRRVWVCGRCLLSLSACVPTPFESLFHFNRIETRSNSVRR